MRDHLVEVGVSRQGSQLAHRAGDRKDEELFERFGAVDVGEQHLEELIEFVHAVGVEDDVLAAREQAVERRPRDTGTA